MVVGTMAVRKNIFLPLIADKTGSGSTTLFENMSIQGCLKFLAIKSVGEEYQVVKRRREYHGCAKEYNIEKRRNGSKIIFPIILRLFRRISSGKKGRGTKN